MVSETDSRAPAMTSPLRRLPSDLPKMETDLEMHMAQLWTEIAEQRRRLMQIEEHLKTATNYNVERPTCQRPLDLILSSAPDPATWSVNDCPDGRIRGLSPARDLEEGVVRDNSVGEFTFRSSKVGISRNISSHPAIPASLAPIAEEQSPLTPRGQPSPALGPFPQRRIFDQDMLKVIYDRPYRKAQKKGAMVAAGLLGLVSMPFGPIGMVVGGTVGVSMGGAVGLWIDQRTARKQIETSEAEKRKLKSLVRWALDHFHEEDEIVELIEHVVLEFKPMADIADGSKHGRKMLKLLDGWIAQKKVTRNLWVYMDMLLQRWRELNRVDFLNSMRVFQTLTVMYQHSHRVLDEQEEQFFFRMQRLLEHESVKLVMAHAQAYPTHNETKLMECMVYADVIGGKKKQNTGGAMKLMESPSANNGAGSPMLSEKNADSESDDDDDRRPNSPMVTALNLGLTIPTGKDIHKETSSRSRSPREGSPLQRHMSNNSLTSKSSKTEPRYIKQLKKPFFKGWDDFMDFDPKFKHKMPITYSEFELVREKSAQSLQGWDLCVDRKEIKIAKTQNSTGCITLRAWATVPGVDLMVAFFMFADHNERVKWDKVFVKMDVIEYNCQGSDVLYSLMKAPAATARDFLQYRRCRINEDNSIEIVLRSAEHPDMPKQKGAIRAESYIAGYLLTQTFEPDGTPILNIFLMSCVDIKGLIPKWIINTLAPRKPAEWVETLKKAAMTYQKNNPNYKEKLEEVLKPYREANPFDYEDVLVEDNEPQHKLCEAPAPAPPPPIDTSGKVLASDAIKHEASDELHDACGPMMERVPSGDSRESFKTCISPEV